MSYIVSVNTISGGDYSGIGNALTGESGLTDDLIIEVTGNADNPENVTALNYGLANFVSNGYSVTVRPAQGQEIYAISRTIDTDIYQILVTDYNAVQITQDITFENIQFVLQTTGTGWYRLVYDSNATQDCTANFYRCLFVNEGGSEYSYAIGVLADNGSYSIQYNLFCCALTGFGGNGYTGFAARSGNGAPSYLENCLIVGNNYGLRNVEAVNCIVFDNDDDFQDDGEYTYCASDDGYSNTGNITVSDWSKVFVDWENDDFNYIDPDPDTNPVIDAGTTRHYAYDFTGRARSGTWDIGPHEGFVDVTAPTFTDGPTAANATPNGHDIQATLDEDGTLYAVKLTAGATAPTSQQVKDGLDSTGSAALEVSSVAATASVQASLTFSAGSSLTAYDYYVVAEDDEAIANLQASPTLVEATTLAEPVSMTGELQAENTSVSGAIFSSADITGNIQAESSTISQTQQNFGRFFQSKVNDQYNTTYRTSMSVTLDSAPTPGNLIVLAVGWQESETVSGLVGTESMTEVPSRGGPNSSQYQTLFYRVVQSDDSETVTADFGTDDARYCGIWVAEIEGPFSESPYDTHAFNHQSSVGSDTDAIVSGAVTPSSSGSAIVGFTQFTSSLPTNTLSAGTGYTMGAQASTGYFGGEVCVHDSTTETTATFTQTTSGNARLTGAFVFLADSDSYVQLSGGLQAETYALNGEAEITTEQSGSLKSQSAAVVGSAETLTSAISALQTQDALLIAEAQIISYASAILEAGSPSLVGRLIEVYPIGEISDPSIEIISDLDIELVAKANEVTVNGTTYSMDLQ
jgi:hypothetical protein